MLLPPRRPAEVSAQDRFEAARQALEGGRTMLLTGGSPLDVLAAVNWAGAAASDPARPSRGRMLWVGTPCYDSVLESVLGTSNLAGLLVGKSAFD